MTCFVYFAQALLIETPVESGISAVGRISMCHHLSAAIRMQLLQHVSSGTYFAM